MDNSMSWIDEREEKNKEEMAKGYFQLVEGSNRFQLLTYCAPLALKWTGSKYEVAQEGDIGVSIKGVCWVLHEGLVKQAKLPYTVIKAIRAYQTNPDWELTSFPIENMITVNAKGAKTKEVEYTVTIAPKKTDISQEIMDEVTKKPTPSEIVEKIKNKPSIPSAQTDYPEMGEENVADKF